MSGLSVSTIKSPEFINIAPMAVNPLISKCEIKVMYVGANRNMSYISKDVATQMAQTLPGTPIVGYYSENAEDFRDHGDQIIVDGDGIKFNCLTKPYGFVPIETKVWFQEFEDTDEFGNKTLREYLMCEGYLWTEQYKEAQKVINEGRPHSMELDDETLKGHWSTDNNRGIDFFIINDAIFSKLCILGEDVEPCFEGSSVTAPEVSSSFTLKEDEFKSTLFTMMKELKELTYSLQNKGGNSMDELNANVQTPEDYVVLDGVENATSAEPEAPVVVEEPAQPEAPVVEETAEVAEDVVLEGEPEVQEAEVVEAPEVEVETQATLEEEASAGEDKYSILEQQFNELSEKYSSLEREAEELRTFKLNIENEKKDELIKSFYMLSDEDKKNVIENKANYTLDEIEKELSVICVRNRVSFDVDSKDNDSRNVTTYNLNSVEVADQLPAWLQAVENNKNRNI